MAKGKKPDPDQMAAVREDLAKRRPITWIAKKHGLSRPTIRRIRANDYRVDPGIERARQWLAENG